jgi:hypothetical protein
VRADAHFYKDNEPRTGNIAAKNVSAKPRMLEPPANANMANVQKPVSDLQAISDRK